MKYLVLGPAAMGILAMIGHLKTIESDIGDVEEISGASAGSIIALFMAMGKTADELIDMSLRLNISDLVKLDLKCFLHTYGFVDLERIREMLVTLCGGDPTFSELNKKIYVSAYCVNRGVTEYFSVDTHPDMKVIDAVCMSIAIPFLFSPRKFMNNTYVDGGTLETLPLAPFLQKPPHTVYCIKIKTNRKYRNDIDDLKMFTEAIINANLNNRYEYTLTHQKCKIIDVGDMDVFDFNMSYEQKIQMYMMGTL